MSSWSQVNIEFSPSSKGNYQVTKEIEAQIKDELKKYKMGIVNIFLLHTSAALTITENHDPHVRTDMDMALDRIAPENLPYEHTEEGKDDMPAHVKSSLTGASLNIPISNGKLVLGTWQGIFLCEFRQAIHKRKAVITISGSTE
ncbi:UPF0047 protein [Smittium culicis]|uniref:UPF0047 protein n=1 Tax=Smittium culicis TaxID=133412 RepID=A0A1R1YEV4_9FUNG|nr:UPF0047 protein [Smittium culicis]